MEEFETHLSQALQRESVFYFLLKVIPGCPETKFTEVLSQAPEWYVKCRVAALPEKGKANTAIIRFLEKKYKCQAEITSGKTSGLKRIKLTT